MIAPLAAEMLRRGAVLLALLFAALLAAPWIVNDLSLIHI